MQVILRGSKTGLKKVASDRLKNDYKNEFERFEIKNKKLDIFLLAVSPTSMRNKALLLLRPFKKIYILSFKTMTASLSRGGKFLKKLWCCVDGRV